MTPYLRGLEAFTDVQRLIVIAAHPDDLETMCGGTVYQLAQRGVEIFSVNCTLGDIGAQDAALSRLELANIRQRETETAARILNLRQTFNLGRPDGELVPDLALRAEIAHLYRRTQADTLFTFDPYWAGQIHPDHRAAGQAALDAYMPSKMPLYRPEQLNEAGAGRGCLARVFLFSPGAEANVVVDVTAVYPQKIAASMAHVSQFPEGEASLDWLKAIDTGIGEQIGVPYAEQFKQMDVW